MRDFLLENMNSKCVMQNLTTIEIGQTSCSKLKFNYGDVQMVPPVVFFQAPLHTMRVRRRWPRTNS